MIIPHSSYLKKALLDKDLKSGIGCGSVGRAVASNNEIHSLNPINSKFYIVSNVY